MREALTLLAGLLVAALLAALLGPGFVDWREYRPHFEQRISAALGVETRVAGEIGLRLLPSPRLTLGEVRLGSGGAETSSASIEKLTAELALAPLARGEFRLVEAEADGLTLNLVADESGAIALPVRQGAGLPSETAIDRLAIRRSALIWREPGKAAQTLAPISVDVSAVALHGPWRVEGEIAGSSLRFATGAIEADGRLRTKASVTGDQTQFGFDGSLILAGADGRVRPGLEGSFTIAPGGAVSLAGRVSGDSRRLDFAGLAVEIAGGAARLEGEGSFNPGDSTGSVQLKARRLDADALSEALAQRPGYQRALQALPGPVDLSLELDQIVWRGEDFSGFALRGKLDGDGIEAGSAAVRIANATIDVRGALDGQGFRGTVEAKAPDARRAALALARLGVEAGLADSFAALRSVDGAATLDWSNERLAISRMTARAGSGPRLEGSGAITASRLDARLTVNGLDLSTLPPGDSLNALTGRRDLALDLTLNGLRYLSAPPGSARVALTRLASDWRLSRLAVDGFGGVKVEGEGALLPGGGEIAGRVRAPRFAALTALAGPLLPEGFRRVLPRIEDGLAGIDASFKLARAPNGETSVVAEGSAQAGRLSLNGKLDAAGQWGGGDVKLSLDDRRRAFAAFGLPRPARGGSGELSLGFGANGPVGSLAGPGLMLVLEGAGDVARLSLQADGPDQILPDGLAPLVPDGVLDASGRVSFGEEARLDDLVVNAGGKAARGALSFSAERGIGGRLDLPYLALQPALTTVIGQAQPVAGSQWSPSRFQNATGLGEVRLALSAERLDLTDKVALSKARLDLAAGPDGLVLDNLRGNHAGGEVSGRLTARREGGLAQINGRLGLSGLDLATLTRGALTGKLSGSFEAGGSGESPARLIAALGGAGSISVTGAGMARFDPAAISKVIATTGDDASESETGRLQDRIGEALEKASWPLGDVTIPFTQAAGVLRVSPVSVERAGLRADASGVVDWRAMTTDLRLNLRPLGAAPKGWPEQLPQVGVAWRGPLDAPRRETDVGALSNVVAARALAREIERVEAFEADQRERAMHVRRLRAERELRENERKLAEFLKAEEERRIVEEKRAEEARKAEEARQVEEARKAESRGVPRRRDRSRRPARPRSPADWKRRASPRKLGRRRSRNARRNCARPRTSGARPKPTSGQGRRRSGPRSKVAPDR